MRPNRLILILENKCPRCAQGSVFGGFVTMNRSCNYCQYNFFPADGFYTGAMYIMVMTMMFYMIPIILLGAAFEGNALIKAGAFAFISVIILSPLFFRFSRLIWLHFSYTEEAL